jgi:SAM-dependent methyltransferase
LARAGDEIIRLLPEPPSRVLEVGCGRGETARALRDAGYDVLAIDPEAPDGDIFVRVTLEELENRAFDVVIAQRSLHHITDLDAAVAKLAELAPRLVVDEFAWDVLDGPTAEWYEGQRRVLAAAGHEPDGPPVAEWREHHAGLHGFDAMRSALVKKFVGVRFESMPYLYRYLGGEATRDLEQTLVDTGAIRPLGFRWVGRRR